MSTTTYDLKSQFTVDGSPPIEDSQGLIVHGAQVEIGGQRLLNEITFTLPAGNLLAIVGPSGAGKSTLLRSLAGTQDLASGSVAVAGHDVAGFDDRTLAQLVGVVPQDDILHRQLTVVQTLDYAARIRMPRGTRARTRHVRIRDVLDQLGLSAHAGQRISTLSGGQRKRVSVALELLTDPPVLLLDEPTSGLDPALDAELMAHLAGLAHSTHRTIVVVTHSVLHLDTADLVLAVAAGGRAAYFGPPSRLLGAFGVADHAAMFTELASGTLASDVVTSGQRALEPADDSLPATRNPGRIAQSRTLMARMTRILWADKALLAFLAGLPVAIALLAQAVEGSDGLGAVTSAAGRSEEAHQILVVMIVGAAFIGMATAIRELVGERAIFHRERAVGLSPAAYLVSKLLVFGVITGVQSLLLVVASLAGRSGPGRGLLIPSGLAEIVASVWMVALVSAIVGLAVSALVTTADQTMPVLVVAVMTQLVLSGGFVKVAGRAGYQEAAYAAPARWGYAAASAVTDLRSKLAVPVADSMWTPKAASLLTPLAVLADMALVAALVTLLALYRKPKRS